MKAKTKASQIREMIKQGKKFKEIARTLETTLQYVHTIAYLDRKKEGKSKKVLPRKKTEKKLFQESFVPEKDNLVKNINKSYVDDLVNKNIKLMKEINDLCTVIDYLEFRLSKEIRRGASV